MENSLGATAKAAREAGMTYGQYVATRGCTPCPVKHVPMGAVRCKVCGSVIAPECRRRRYCSDLCYEKAMLKKKRESKAARRARNAKGDT